MGTVPPKDGELDYKFWAGISSQEVYNSFSTNFPFSNPLIHIPEEIVYTDKPTFKHVKDKKVLIIGGGPSSKEILSLGLLSHYDFVWATNHAFRNKLLRKFPVHSYWISFELDLKELNEFLTTCDHKPYIGFLYGKRHIDNKKFINKFYRNDRKYCVFTKLFTTLGICVRQIYFASLLGAKQVDFCGLDGIFGLEKASHSFKNPEEAKTKPFVLRWNEDFAKECFQFQYDAFWDLVIKRFPFTKYKNLANNNNPYHRKLNE